MALAVLGLGSNRPFGGMEPARILEEAASCIGQFLGGMRLSSIYMTRPMYVEEQPPFLNMAACGNFFGTAFELLERIHGLEAKFGRDRRRETRNGPRPLDIDIELFGGETISSPALEVPHPRMAERAFVLVPAAEALERAGEILEAGRLRAMLDKIPHDERTISPYSGGAYGGTCR